MFDSIKTFRPLVILCILCTSWVCFAQVQDPSKPKSAPAVKNNDILKPAVDPAKKALDGNLPPAAPANGAPNKPLIGNVGNLAVPAKGNDPKKPAAAEEATSADETAIRQSADAFTTAYNAHQAKTISELFALKAELTDENGNVIKGREAIEQDFAQTFTKFPETKIQLEIGSIRILTPNIAVEEGIVRGQPIPGEGESVSAYVAVHVKVEGRWLLASVSDYAIPVEMTAHDHLEELAWMVGDWIEESPDSAVKSSVRWDETGNYLIQDFVLHIAGAANASGSTRIGWDALRGHLKSWTFNADGGHSEGYWTRDGDSWTVKSHGANAKGEATSATSVYRVLDGDTMTWRSYDRVVGGVPKGDVPEFVIKRHAPTPGF
ncbi:MAG: SgcJ/EcaC family oxidoreductase [Schlesneria sp.]